MSFSAVTAAFLTLVSAQHDIPAPPPASEAVFRMEGSTGGFGIGDDVSMHFHVRRASAESGPEPYWLAHVRRDYSGVPGQQEQLDHWIDGRQCPAVAEAVDALRRFRPPSGYQPSEVGRAARFAPHGTRYVLTTTGAMNGGETTTVTVDETGLVLRDLTERTLASLRPCIS